MLEMPGHFGMVGHAHLSSRILLACMDIPTCTRSTTGYRLPKIASDHVVTA